MDFELGEELSELGSLATTIFADRAAASRLREVETGPTRVDDQLWAVLSRAGLLAACLPGEVGGGGLGLAGAAVLLEQQGRTVAPVPLWSAVLAARALASASVAEDVVASLVSGEARVTLALEEYGAPDPSAPRARARSAGTGWRLSGTKAVVPSPQGASHVLASAQTDRGAGLFLVPVDAPGVSWRWSESTSLDMAGELTLDDVDALGVGDPDGLLLGRVLAWSRVALAALQVGVANGALALATSYLSGRRQFGRPLGSFQAVQHQLADCQMAIDAMWLTTWQAVELLDADEPDDRDAERASLVAAWWCGQSGLDVVHRVQHLHGGLGVDVDYPVHRHFLWGKQIASTLGGPELALERLGELLAPVIPDERSAS